jgi:hypothetical protein
MNLFDPSRPRLSNGLPMYPVDHPVAAVPSLSLVPQEDGGARLDVMLAIEPNSYRRFKQVSLASIETVLRDWRANPEEAMRKHFNWTFTYTVPKKREPTLTLADLGL